MSRRSYTALDDKSASTANGGRRARASRSSNTTSSNNSGLILGLTTSIGELSKANSKLERSLVRLGTTNDNPSFRQRLTDDQHDTNSLVKSTIDSLAAAQPLLDSVQYQRLSLQFEAAYKKYTTLTKQIEDKQKQLLSHSQHSSQPPSQQHSHSSSNNAYNNSHNPYSSSDYQQQQQQQYGEQQYDQEDDVIFTEMEHEEIVKRVEEIKQIETEVSEVAQLYKDLHVLVNEQQSDLDTIAENVQVVNVKVERGHEQLLRASGNQRSARNLKCWVAVIVCVVIGLAIVVLLVLKKNKHFLNTTVSITTGSTSSTNKKRMSVISKSQCCHLL